MTLRLIGAGLGRTGTSSLRLALHALGHPTYHMFDLAFGAARARDVAFWSGIRPAPRPTTAPDWGTVLSNYDAVLDYPSCLYWRDLMAAHPEAKVILTRHPRGSEAWYDSTASTIYTKPKSDGSSAFGQAFNEMMADQVWGGFFENRFEDRAFAIARYEAHNQAVIDTVPADRLVIYSVTEGWAPLCAALGVDVPEIDFPQANDRAEMTRRMQLLDRAKRLRQPIRPRDGTNG